MDRNRSSPFAPWWAALESLEAKKRQGFQERRVGEKKAKGEVRRVQSGIPNFSKEITSKRMCWVSEVKISAG
jgi:hypothetical protein